MDDVRQEAGLLLRGSVGKEDGRQHAHAHAPDLGRQAGGGDLTLPDEVLRGGPSGAAELRRPLVGRPAPVEESPVPAALMVPAPVIALRWQKGRPDQGADLIPEADFVVRQAEIHGRALMEYYIFRQ